MRSIIYDIIEYSNLLFAWKKFKNSSERGEVWHDGFDFVSYEANLHRNLLKIRNEVLSGKYRLTIMNEVPYPKGSVIINEKATDIDDDPCIQFISERNLALRYRVTYQISISDQILWIAIINIIGDVFEKQMPEWSYNYRLYRRVWYDEKKIKKGLIRPSDKQFYRKWTQTWPLYKKQISATIRILKYGVKKVIEIDDSDAGIINNAENLIYYHENFFENKNRNEIYWASLDIKKFYPSVNIHLLEKKLTEPKQFKDDVCYCNLIKTMLDFKVEKPIEKHIGLPTGLFVAGFLSNVYLLNADNYVNNKFEKNTLDSKPQNIAHFRYVDDHIILATDYDALVKWVNDYSNFLKENLELTINEDKSNLSHELDSSTNKKNAIISTDYPTPLMTISLQKLSSLSSLNLEFLSKREFDLVLMDLQQMLITNIPEEEIKRETRISFSITMLSRIMVDGYIDWDALYHIRSRILMEIRSREKNLEIDNVLKLLFDDRLPLIKNLEKSPIPEIDEYNQTFYAEFKRKEQLIIKIFNLIKYALNEEPNKPKIWLRALEFIYRNSKYKVLPEVKIDMLVDLLEYQKNNKIIHEQSYDYLLSVLITEIGIWMLRSLFDEQFNAVNNVAYETLIKFINNEDTKKKFIYKSAINVAKSACLYYSFKHKIDIIFPLDYNDTMYELYALATVSDNKEAYNYIFHLHKPDWKESKYKKAYLKAVLSSKNIIEDMLSTDDGKNVLIDSYNICHYPVKELDYMENFNKSKNGSELYKVIADESLCYHQRIELMIAIAKNVQKLNSNDSMKINIYNFTVTQNNEVSFVDNVSDNRCQSHFTYINKAAERPLYQLGIIFYQILIKESFIPEILNSDKTELNWNRYLLNMYKKCTISSMSLAILRSCLLDRSFETVSIGIKNHLSMEDIDDIALDPPIFMSISDMIQALEMENKFLKRYQVKDTSDGEDSADDVILMQVTNISKNFNPIEHDGNSF